MLISLPVIKNIAYLYASMGKKTHAPILPLTSLHNAAVPWRRELHDVVGGNQLGPMMAYGPDQTYTSSIGGVSPSKLRKQNFKGQDRHSCLPLRSMHVLWSTPCPLPVLKCCIRTPPTTS